ITAEYNCIAWAVEDVEHWWQPGKYWQPSDAPADDFSLDALKRVFSALRYVNCEMDHSVEPGYEKVALYGTGSEYSHAARQLATGKWTSKLGKSEDIEHETPFDVVEGIYGELRAIMKRRTS